MLQRVIVQKYNTTTLLRFPIRRLENELQVQELFGNSCDNPINFLSFLITYNVLLEQQTKKKEKKEIKL